MLSAQYTLHRTPPTSRGACPAQGKHLAGSDRLLGAGRLGGGGGGGGRGGSEGREGREGGEGGREKRYLLALF